MKPDNSSPPARSVFLALQNYRAPFSRALGREAVTSRDVPLNARLRAAGLRSEPVKPEARRLGVSQYCKTIVRERDGVSLFTGKADDASRWLTARLAVEAVAS